jgi:hypothetical protein
MWKLWKVKEFELDEEMYTQILTHRIQEWTENNIWEKHDVSLYLKFR